METPELRNPRDTLCMHVKRVSNTHSQNERPPEDIKILQALHALPPRHSPLPCFEPENLIRGVFDKPRCIGARLCSRIAGAADLHVEVGRSCSAASSQRSCSNERSQRQTVMRRLCSLHDI